MYKSHGITSDNIHCEAFPTSPSCISPTVSRPITFLNFSDRISRAVVEGSEHFAIRWRLFRRAATNWLLEDEERLYLQLDMTRHRRTWHVAVCPVQLWCACECCQIVLSKFQVTLQLTVSQPSRGALILAHDQTAGIARSIYIYIYFLMVSIPLCTMT
jgi:hypothetical protein